LNIRILENKENFGTYYSRNRGILMSKGEYILIVDGDDYIDSTYIENMVNNLKNSDKKIWGYGVHFERVYLNNHFIKLSLFSFFPMIACFVGCSSFKWIICS
jgi:glycosyltransferase involved in cell wall biosynthesis